MIGVRNIRTLSCCLHTGSQGVVKAVADPSWVLAIGKDRDVEIGDGAGRKVLRLCFNFFGLTLPRFMAGS